MVCMDSIRIHRPRTRVQFASGDSHCVAWHYPGCTGALRGDGRRDPVSS
jgi:hypothetical protein